MAKEVDRKSEKSSNPLPGPSHKTTITLDDDRTKTGVGDSNAQSGRNAEKAFPKGK